MAVSGFPSRGSHRGETVEFLVRRGEVGAGAVTLDQASEHTSAESAEPFDMARSTVYRVVQRAAA